MVRLLPLLGVAACFQTVHRPICVEEGVTVLADDEETPAGSAAALLARVQVDGAPHDGTLEDGAAATALVSANRGAGPAEWVEMASDTDVTRSWGFGSVHLLLAVICNDHLRIPVDVLVATDDGAVSVPAAGDATMTADGVGLPFSVYVTGAYEDAVFPAGEDDPDDYTGKSAFIRLDHDEAGLLGGAAGWEGERETADAHVSIASYAVTFERAPQ